MMSTSMQRSRTTFYIISRKINLKGFISRIYIENPENTIQKEQTSNEKQLGKRYFEKKKKISRLRESNEKMLHIISGAQTTKLFSQVFVSFYILTNFVKSSSCSTACQHLVSLSNFSYFHGCRVVSYWVFLLIQNQHVFQPRVHGG